MVWKGNLCAIIINNCLLYGYLWNLYTEDCQASFLVMWFWNQPNQFLASKFQTDLGEPHASKSSGSLAWENMFSLLPLSTVTWWQFFFQSWVRGSMPKKPLSSSKFTAWGYNVSFRLFFKISVSASLAVKVTAGDKNKKNHQRNPCAEFPYMSFHQER